MRITFLAPVLLALLGATATGQEPMPPKADVEEAAKAIRRGEALFEQGKVAEALAQFVRAKGLDPYEVIAPYKMAQCEFILGQREGDAKRFENARRLLREAQMLDPRWGEIYFLWGVIGAHTGRYGDAKVGFEQSLKRTWRIKECKVNLAQALFFYGVEQAKANVPHTDVIRTFQEAVDRLETVKDDLEYPADMRAACRGLWIKALTNLAAMRQRANDLPEAEKVLGRLIRIEPTNYLHHYNLGLVHGASKRFEEAMRHYEKALELNPDETWLEPLKFMGYIHSQQDRPELAEKLLTRYLAGHPESWDAHYYLAEHYSRSGKLEESVRSYLRCIEIDRAKYTAMYRLAQVLRRVKRPDEADKWLDLYRTLEAEDK
ncbi:MAG: tetratricopeptide repeat protein [Planctomycetota bacterium]